MSTFPAELTGTWVIDESHSTVGFAVKHAVVATTRGKFTSYSGGATIDAANPESSSLWVEIDASSVDTGSEQRDGHLKSPDFFDVEKFPQITFKSSNFAFDGDNVKSATGELTMNGITRPVTLTANVFKCAPHPVTKKMQCGADFVTTVKRSDFGMKYALGPLADEVTLRISVESMKD